MSNWMPFLGIYPVAIGNAIDQCELAMKNTGFGSHAISEMHDMAEECLKETGSFEDITNSIIYAYFSTTKDMIERCWPGHEVDYFINCSDSHFYIDGEEQI